jgi:hypothetical protein
MSIIQSICLPCKTASVAVHPIFSFQVRPSIPRLYPTQTDPIPASWPWLARLGSNISGPDLDSDCSTAVACELNGHTPELAPKALVPAAVIRMWVNSSCAAQPNRSPTHSYCPRYVWTILMVHFVLTRRASRHLCGCIYLLASLLDASSTWNQGRVLSGSHPRPPTFGLVWVFGPITPCFVHPLDKNCPIMFLSSFVKQLWILLRST